MTYILFYRKDDKASAHFMKDWYSIFRNRSVFDSQFAAVVMDFGTNSIKARPFFRLSSLATAMTFAL